MTIAELRRYRESQDISQLELGRRSGVNSTKICKAERGHIELRKDELAALETGLRAILRDRERRVNAGMLKLAVGTSQDSAPTTGAHLDADNFFGRRMKATAAASR